MNSIFTASNRSKSILLSACIAGIFMFQTWSSSASAQYYLPYTSSCSRTPFAKVCWRCPRGYVAANSNPYSGASGSLCKKVLQTRANYHRKAERFCPRGTFKDPRNGGECWSCPRGYKRTIFAVYSASACEKPTGFLRVHRTRAKFHKRLRLCPHGAFYDPRKGGECWSCPHSYKRTVFAVYSTKACEKVAIKKICAASTTNKNRRVSKKIWDQRCR